MGIKCDDDKKENEQKLKEYDGEIQTLKDKKALLVNEIPTYKSDVDAICKQIDAETAKYNECRSEVKYETECNELRQECKSLKSEYEVLRKELNENAADSESERYELIERIEKYVNCLQTDN